MARDEAREVLEDRQGAGAEAVALVRDHADGVVVVREGSIRRAVRELALREGLRTMADSISARSASVSALRLTKEGGAVASRTSSRRRPRTRQPRAHAAGTGPDSVYFHAVRPGRVPIDGPRAVCGYPLRTRTEDIHADGRTFEERWSARDDCCADCGATLGLEEVTGPSVEGPVRKRNWVLIGAVATLLPMLAGLLARVVPVALR